MPASELTEDQCRKLGERCRRETSNLLIASFAAEMAGESYPLSPSMCDIMFDYFIDEDLGRAFAKWIDKGHDEVTAGES
jgi:hypothetical protein